MFLLVISTITTGLRLNYMYCTVLLFFAADNAQSDARVP